MSNDLLNLNTGQIIEIDADKVFYHFEDDLKACPEALIYCVVGGRNTGKTYSTLKLLYENHITFAFIKRTDKDVDILCASGNLKKTKNIDADLSPFKPLNNDYGWNVKPVKVVDGIGAFYNFDEDGNPYGLPVGWIVSLHSVKKVKGFGIDECDIIVFDEFIPLPYERVDRKECEQLMDFYKTVQRSKFIKGRRQLMIMLANAADITAPILIGMELSNHLAQMQINDESTRFLEDRLIYIHRLNDNPEFIEIEKQNPIYKVMNGTAWAEMSLENKFSYNDLSCIKKVNLKNHIPVLTIIYKSHRWTVYNRDGKYHMCSTNAKCIEYNLNREIDQKRFYNEWVWELKDTCVNGSMTFTEITMYDLIMNYKKYFEV